MKDIKEYINESYASTIINKIKDEFNKKFADKVTISSTKTSYEQLYIVYVYDNKLETLKEVNEILKKQLSIWRGLTDDEMQDKLKENQEFLNNHKDDPLVTQDRYPIEFFRFTSKDLKKIKSV